MVAFMSIDIEIIFDMCRVLAKNVRNIVSEITDMCQVKAKYIA
jgi:hypothetical protein